MNQQIAIYLRLSIEDGRANDVNDESNSISNQRKLILDFIRQKPDFSDHQIQEFCDDGYSGTNMDRPGMQRLLSEIKRNKIDCIIVKDMSRFSRDYIEMGTFLNQIFPFMGIRFISVNDHYDSKEQDGNTIDVDIAFQTLVYDLYSRDLSVKLKAAFRNQCDRGEYVFRLVPLGYEKSKEKKNQVVVNENEAEIVRHIFSLAARGMGCTQIAKQLHREGIPTATQIRCPAKAAEKANIAWNPHQIRKILTNRFYLGEMIYGKSTRELVGSKKQVALPKQEWNVIPNHHEPLVTRETFECACAFRPGRSTKRKGEKHPLTGKVFCGGCGYALNYKRTHFWCQKHSLLQIMECCTYINSVTLEETILFLVNQEIRKRCDDKKQKEEWERYRKKCQQIEQKRCKAEKQQYDKIEMEESRLYRQYAAQQMTAADYHRLADELKAHLPAPAKAQKENPFAGMTELTQEMVAVFIKKIHIFKGGKIEIEWNFTEGENVW